MAMVGSGCLRVKTVCGLCVDRVFHARTYGERRRQARGRWVGVVKYGGGRLGQVAVSGGFSFFSLRPLKPVAVAVGNSNVQGTPLLFSYPSFQLDWAVYKTRPRSRPGGKRASVRQCVNAAMHVPGRSHKH